VNRGSGEVEKVDGVRAVHEHYEGEESVVDDEYGLGEEGIGGFD
jgi:hypothetical protein